MSDTQRLHRLVVLTVVRDRANRVLLVRSARRAQRWELAGGAVEAGESPMEAARREIREETGFEVGNLTLVGLYYGENDLLLRFVFAAIVDDTETRPPDCEAIRQGEILETAWFTPHGLPSPMPILARRMIRDSARERSAVLATVRDDRELAD